jgi:hypothetical protein
MGDGVYRIGEEQPYRGYLETRALDRAAIDALPKLDDSWQPCPADGPAVCSITAMVATGARLRLQIYTTDGTAAAAADRQLLHGVWPSSSSPSMSVGLGVGGAHGKISPGDAWRMAQAMAVTTSIWVCALGR